MKDSCAKVALRATRKDRARRLELGEELSDLEPGPADEDTDTDELSDTCPVGPVRRRAAGGDTSLSTGAPLDDSGAASSDAGLVEATPRRLDDGGPTAARLRSALGKGAKAAANRRAQLNILATGKW